MILLRFIYVINKCYKTHNILQLFLLLKSIIFKHNYQMKKMRFLFSNIFTISGALHFFVNWNFFLIPYSSSLKNCHNIFVMHICMWLILWVCQPEKVFIFLYLWMIFLLAYEFMTDSCFFFFIRSLKMFLYCLVLYCFWQKSAKFFYYCPLNVGVFFLWFLLRFLTLWLVFSNLIIMCFVMVLFITIQTSCLIFVDFWICEFIAFIKFRKSVAIFFFKCLSVFNTFSSGTLITNRNHA